MGAASVVPAQRGGEATAEQAEPRGRRAAERIGRTHRGACQQEQEEGDAADHPGRPAVTGAHRASRQEPHPEKAPKSEIPEARPSSG